VKKILHIVESFGGGVFTVVSQICNTLAEQGYEVHLAYSRRQETPDNLEGLIHKDVVLHEIHLTRNINFKEDFLGLIQVYRLFKAIHPDLVHLHSSKAGVLGRIAALFFKVKTFYSPHGFSFLQKDAGKIKKALYIFIERICNKLGGVVVPCSPSEGEEARRTVGATRIKIVENAVDTSKIPLASSNKNGDIVQIGLVGRITLARNPEVFLRLAEAFRSRPVKFVWIGGGDSTYEERLSALPNVEVTGWLARDEALKKMTDLDIYLHPSLWEGMPLSVIEATVAGLPAIVTDVVGNRDIITHGKNGFIVKNDQEIVHYLDELINDSALRLKMGQYAREESLRRFGLARFKQDLFSLYGPPDVT
jgi:glycosyltransferase involved in cell wall biosynthesis